MSRLATAWTRGVKDRVMPCLRILLGLVATWQLTLESAHTAPTAPAEPFRLAMSSSMFSEVNENDARAAMKVWILTVANERNIPVDPDPHIHPSVEDMVTFCQRQPVDGFGLTTPEFPQLSQRVKISQLAVGVRDGSITEEYVLLVRKDRGVERLDQLRGASINILRTPRMSLARIWLDTLLLEAQLGRVDNFFGQISSDDKAAAVALPVFFGKADACLMTRASFAVLGELNPQLDLQLGILAVSPEVVPAGFAFRENDASPIMARILQSMKQLGESPAGRQILALTQADRIETRPISCLEQSLELLERHRRLSEASPAGRTPTSTPAGAR